MGTKRDVEIRVKAKADEQSFKSLVSTFEETRKKLNQEMQKHNVGSDSRNALIKQYNDIQKLQILFENSYNKSLNSLNISRFNEGLSRQSIELKSIINTFSVYGSEGRTALNNLLTGIVTTNREVSKTKTLFDEMWNTMSNTIKWGISSSIMNSFTGSVSEAYGYVKNLDKSLNNIRIVSGQSADQMEKFAKHAGEAAQSLGASTLDYSNAALIYYQQGLDDEQVQQMTDITVKMSNVLGTSAEEVSNYMTAIWNNFDDGSHSLEYYADVLTALGAATASSAEEISTGLEKFAAIADATGLSYEYATAALTTVTAKTRQSAEVVGTAFKTLFARIQDLELGNTLDDGTTLGKYSEALYKVGINIKDSNGQLKDMDEILSEMGKKWDTLGEAEKVALAQTVAGVRQYNQLMALMENWDYFQENLQTARNATGTLVDQQEIYMESTEAHLESAQAAWDEFKTSLLDNDTINFFADLSKFAGNFATAITNGFGGGLPLLAGAGGFATSLFSTQISQSLMDVFSGLSLESQRNKKIQEQEKVTRDLFKEVGGVDKSTLTSTVKKYQEILPYLDKMDESAQENFKKLILERANAENAVETLRPLLEEANIFLDNLDSGLSELSFTNRTLRAVKINKEEQEKIAEVKKQQELEIGQIQVDRKSPEYGKQEQKIVQKANKEIFKIQKEAKEKREQERIKDQEKISKAEGKRVETLDQEISQSNVEDSVKIGRAKLDELLQEVQATEEKFNEIYTQKAEGVFNELSTESLGSTTEYTKEIQQDLMTTKDTANALIESLKVLQEDGYIDIFDEKEIEDIKNAEQALKDLESQYNYIESSNKKKDGTYKKRTKVQVEDINKIKKETLNANEIAARSYAKLKKKIIDTQDVLTDDNVKTFFVNKSELETINNSLKEVKKEGQQLSKIDMFTNATGGALQLTSGISALSNAMNALVSEELTPLEALSQIFISLTTGVPMLINGFNKIIPVLNFLNDSRKKSIALQTMELTVGKRANAQQTKDIILKTKKNLEKKNGVALTTKEIIQQGVQNGQLTKEQALKTGWITQEELRNKIKLKDISLSTIKTAIMEKLTLAQIKFNTAAAANPYVLIAMAIVAAIAAIATLVTWNKKATEAENERKTAIIEKQNAEQEEINKNIELVEQNKALIEQYKQGEISREELLKSSSNLIEGYDAESIRVATLTGDYDKLTESLNKYKQAQIEAALESAKAEKQAAEGVLLNTAREGAGRKDLLGKYEHVFTSTGAGKKDDAIIEEELNKAGIVYARYKNTAFSVQTDMSTEEIIQLYDTYSTIRDRMEKELGEEVSDSAAYQNIVEWLTKMKTSVDNYKASVSDIDNYSIQNLLHGEGEGKLNLQDIDNYEDFLQKKNLLEIYLSTLKSFDGKTKDEISAAAVQYLQGLNNDIINDYIDQSASEKSLADVFGIQYKNLLQGIKLDPQQLKGLLNPENKDAIIEAFDSAFAQNPEAFKTKEGFQQLITSLGSHFRDESVSAVTFTDSLKEQLETLGYSEEEFTEYVDQLQKLNPAFKNDVEAAKAFAIANIRLNKGVKDLADNFEDLEPILKDNKRGTSGFASALEKAQGIIANVLNLESGDILSDDFYTSAENLKLMEQAAKGSEKAIEKLRKKAGDNIIEQFKVGVEDESVLNALDNLNSLVKNYDLSDIEVGMSVNDQEFVDSLNEYIVAAKMTKEQAERYLNSMNLKGVGVTTTKVPVEHEIEGPLGLKLKYTEWLTYPQFEDVEKIGDDKPKIDTKPPSGGGGKSKKELPTNEKDIYHDINIELEQIGQRLEKISKLKEGLLGQDYIDKLREEYELLNKTIEKTEEKLKIATKEQEKLKSSLAGMGAKFNSDGSISNYSALYDKEFKRYEDAVKKYNAGKLSEKNLEKAEKRWEKFQEDLDKYDELLIDIIPELEMDILEKELEQFELKMDGFTYSIEMRLDLKEAEQDWNEFIKDLNYRDNEIMGEVVLNRNNLDSLFKEDGSGILQSLTNQINNTIAEIEEIETTGSSDIYGTNKEQAMEDLETYAGEMREALLELQDIQDNLHQSYVDMMDETQEKLDEQIEAYETITDLIEHEKELISLTYGEDSYEELSALYDKQLENNKQQLDALRQQTAFWHSQMLTLKEGSDEWEAAKEKWLAAVQAEKEAILSSIQELQDWYLNEIDKMFDNINKNVTGGLGLDYASKEWDLINKNADQYLDNVNAIYSIQQLQNKYLDAIEKTDNLGTQKKLNDLMKQELATLREQDKLSQYDIDRANLKYEIALKQMALEEAQQNKNTMRLRRDSQGNYTYQYVADEDEISSVQEELANLYNELYNMDYDKYRENLAEITEIWTEAQEQMREAAQINDPDERAKQEKLIQEQYGQLINSLVEQNEALKSNMYQSTMSQLFDLYDQNAENYDLMTEEQKLILDNFLTEETNLEGAAFDNLFDLYNENIEQFKNMTDAQQEELMGSLLPQWETAYQQMADTIRGEGGFFEVYKTTFEDMKTLANEYLEMLLQITQSENYEEIKNSNEELFTNLEEFVGKTDEILEAYDAQLEKIAEVIAEVENLILKYKQAEESALAAAEAGQGVIEEEKKEDSTLDVDLDDNKDDTSDPDDGTDESDASKASNGAPFKDTYTVKRGDTLSGIGAQYGVSYKRIYAENRNVIGPDEDLIKPGMKLKIPAYQSGGYTGDWAGTGGQLAMLHKKELVLNASDTKNLLGAMDILRSITDNLGASLFNTISAISAHGASPAWANAGGDSLQQDVHITAEFPNVTNSHEIEDALNNLVNHASQYIQK